MGGHPLELQVECYAGYRGEETPQRMFLGTRAITVESVLDRWIDPAHRYFKLRGGDGGIYIVRFDVAQDRWELVLYDSGARTDTRLSST